MQGRWIDADKVRFYRGKPEKIGGAAKLTANTLTGTCRGMHAFRDASNGAHIGFGTPTKLFEYDDTNINNRTPFRLQVTLANNPFATTVSSATVTVTHTAHGAAVGDAVVIAGSAAVGGITPSGTYVIATVPGANSYTITHGSAATSTATGGGAAVTADYEIAVGLTDSTATVHARTWDVDHKVSSLIACPRGLGIYRWTLADARAAAIANAPATNNGMFITAEGAIVSIAPGLIKMRLQWCDLDDITVWTPADTNSADIRDLQNGNEIVCGRRIGPGVSGVWTDKAMYLMQYTADDFVYRVTEAGDVCGALGPHAATTNRGAAYWFAHDDFCMWDGAVRSIPNANDIRKFVFDDINRTQRHKVHVVAIDEQSEIWFFYCTAAATEIDRYAIVNTQDWSWTVGTWARTASLAPGVYADPLMTAVNGTIYKHESGLDDDGAAINANITSAPFEFENGERSLDVNGIIADFDRITGNVTMDLLSREYPADSDTTDSFTLTSTSKQVDDPRVNGRQIAVKFTSNAVGGDFRLGTPRLLWDLAGDR